MALTIAVCVPRGHRSAAWAQIGFRAGRRRAVLLAVAVPTAVVALSFSAAAAVGVVAFPRPETGSGEAALVGAVTTLLFTVVLLGEEIGWRGFLLPRLAALVSGRTAALLAGASHAAFHLPLLTLTTTYHSAGHGWIIVGGDRDGDLAGVWYAWLRSWSASIWPVALSHSAFNATVETADRAAITTSPAAMAYTTTEAGLGTLLIVVVLAVYLLTRRADDFAHQ